VKDFGLFVVTMDTRDNRKVIIANGTASAGTIQNFTVKPIRRVDIDVSTHANADADEALAVINAECPTATPSCT
jgi:small-conductance mechanosensitive channel